MIYNNKYIKSMNNYNDIITQLQFRLDRYKHKSNSIEYKEWQLLFHYFLIAESETNYFKLHDILSTVSSKLNKGMCSSTFYYWRRFLQYMNDKITLN